MRLLASPPCFAAALPIAVLFAKRLPVILSVALGAIFLSVFTFSFVVATVASAIFVTDLELGVLAGKTFSLEECFFSSEDLKFGASLVTFVADCDLVWLFCVLSEVLGSFYFF